MKEKTKKFLKENKRKVLISFIGLIIIIILIILSCIVYKSSNDIYIEIASSHINYVYGPSGETTVKMNVGDSLQLNIITSKFKKPFVKCYSTNEEIISFKKNDVVKGIGAGNASVSCNLNNTKSNKIDIKVGD